MSESLEDQVSRLRTLSEYCPGSPLEFETEDLQAIELAVRVLSVIQAANPMMGIPIYKSMTGVGMRFGCNTYSGQSLLECFLEAGRDL